MGMFNAPSSRDGSGFAEFPGARALYFLMGTAFLAAHALVWRGIARGDEEWKGRGGLPWVILALTAVFAGAFLTGAFQRRNRAGESADAGSGVATSSGGMETPPGIPAEPLKAGVTGTAAHRIRRPREGVLVVAPTSAMEFALVGFGLACGALTYAVRNDMHESGGIALAASPVLVLVGCLLLVVRRKNVFDLGNGSFRQINILGFGRKVPLSQVRAVQLLTDVPRESSVDASCKKPYEAFQLNLVLHDADRPRRYLLEDEDRDSTERIGVEIAEFLGVPLYRTSLAKKTPEL